VQCYSGGSRTEPPPRAPLSATGKLKDYSREEAATFLMLPEWYIVYNTAEYARFIGAHSPSSFPYGGSITQYWRYYGGMCAATKDVYPFSGGNHMMLAVIGSSFTGEYIVRGSTKHRRPSHGMDRRPRNPRGRLCAEDRGRVRPHHAHSALVRVPILCEGGATLARDPDDGAAFHPEVGERKLALTAEFTAKGIYGKVIGFTSGATYGAEELRIHAWIENVPDAAFADGVVKKAEQLGPRSYIVTLPRYEAFPTRAKLLVKQNVRFLEIAGNDDILATIIARGAVEPGSGVVSVLDERFLTDTSTRRIALAVPVLAARSDVASGEERRNDRAHL